MATKKYFSKLNVLDSSGISQEAYVKDAEAREEIEKLKNIKGINYIGPSSTTLTDGMTITEVASGGQDGVNYIGVEFDRQLFYGWGVSTSGITLKPLEAGMLFTYTVNGREMEFVVSIRGEGIGPSGGHDPYVATFHEFGSTGSLKALAFKDSATVTGTAASHSHTYSKAKITDSSLVLKNGIVTSSGTYTPAGTNSSSTVTASGSYTPAGTNSSSAVTASGSYTPAGTNADSSVSASGSYTPAGTNSSSNVTASGSFKPAGTNASSSVTLTGGSTGKLVTSTVKQITSTDASTLCKVSYDANAETIDFTPVTFENVTVATGSVAANGSGSTVATALPSGGTAAAQVFTGTSATVSVSGTAAAQTFTGTAKDVSVSGTAAAQTFTGTAKNVSVSGTAAAQTFTGTAKDVSVSGTAAAQTFTGTAKSVSVSGTGATTVEHFDVSIGYDTVNSGTAAPTISGTAS